MRPASIVLFERIYWFAIIVGMLSGIWTYLHMSAMMPPVPGPVAGIMPIVMGVSMIVGIAINILLWFFIARKGSVVAKWIMVVLTAIGVAGLALSFARGDYPAGLPGILTALRTLLIA